MLRTPKTPTRVVPSAGKPTSREAFKRNTPSVHVRFAVSTGVAVVDDELFRDGAQSAFAPVPDVAGRFPPGRFQRRRGHGQPSATVLGDRRRGADAAFAPFAHVVDGGRGRRRTRQDPCRRYGATVDYASAATAAADGGRLRDGRQIGGGVAPASAAPIAGATQAEEVVRRDQKSGVRGVFHGAQIVQDRRGLRRKRRSDDDDDVAAATVQTGPSVQHAGPVEATPPPVAGPRTRVRRRVRRR